MTLFCFLFFQVSRIYTKVERYITRLLFVSPKCCICGCACSQHLGGSAERQTALWPTWCSVDYLSAPSGLVYADGSPPLLTVQKSHTYVPERGVRLRPTRPSNKINSVLKQALPHVVVVMSLRNGNTRAKTRVPLTWACQAKLSYGTYKPQQ